MVVNIEFETWLRTFAKNSSNSFVRDSEDMIQYLFELDRGLPSKYGWRATSVMALGEQLKRAKSAEEINSIYWQNMARSIEAYGLMVIWRGTELTRAALRSLNSHEILAPAVLSRSLLELAATVLVNSNTIQNTVEDILAFTMPSKGVAVCGELEELLTRIIYGTRIGNPPEHLKQTNILTYIQRVSRHPDASDLLQVYEYLCDLAHPNVLGNARFWARVQETKEGGSPMLRMERHAESMVTEETREKILWALGWSAACARNGFEIGQKTVQAILKRWPKSNCQGARQDMSSDSSSLLIVFETWRALYDFCLLVRSCLKPSLC